MNLQKLPRYYFDWAASAEGNPSSRHVEGRAAKTALEKARSGCAQALGVKPEELVFTSGGTEANAIVLFSLLRKTRRAASGSPAELLYSAAEHPSVRENCAVLEQLGLPCAVIPLENDGRVAAAALEKMLAKNPAPRMAAIMAVNNETGAVNDMKALAAVFRSLSRPQVHLHCDLVQAAGKIPVDLYDWDIDSASVSAHKLGGPRGIGLLWLKKPLIPLIQGGGQEGTIRPGTENTAGALELARVLEERAGASLTAAYQAAAERMNVLMSSLQKTGAFIPIPNKREDGDTRFSPWILQCAFKSASGGTTGRFIPGEVMVRALDEKGFAVSTGSACSLNNTKTLKKRYVLESMGVDSETSLGGIRISQGWSTTMEDIQALAEVTAELCRTL
ncbi:aminotransferase V [Spirochaetia bacterium]|nr:aminotransferase V [Spirochaetia bacterium]